MSNLFAKDPTSPRKNALSNSCSIYLDFLRAGTALTVFLHHFAFPNFTDGHFRILNAHEFGADAVIVFFVLSGLIIAFCGDQMNTTLRGLAFSHEQTLLGSYSGDVPWLAHLNLRRCALPGLLCLHKLQPNQRPLRTGSSGTLRCVMQFQHLPRPLPGDALLIADAAGHAVRAFARSRSGSCNPWNMHIGRDGVRTHAGFAAPSNKSGSAAPKYAKPTAFTLGSQRLTRDYRALR